MIASSARTSPASRHFLLRSLVSGAHALALGTVAVMMSACASAQVSVATYSAGSGPDGVAVNPLTNKVYVANWATSGANGLTILNAATGTSSSLTTGANPQAVAVDLGTNIIYVANRGGNSVTVVDGSTDTVTATITSASFNGPDAIAVNPVTHIVYVANYATTASASTVTVICGAGASTTTCGTTYTVKATVAAGTSPRAIGVDPVTNQVYVANSTSNNVTVINGSTNATTTLTVGSNPQSVAINAVTNKVYIGNSGTNTVTVINGAGTTTSSTTGAITPYSASLAGTITVGSGPYAIAVDPIRNLAYVACVNTTNAYVITGSGTATAISGVGSGPGAIAINSQTGIVYVTSRVSNLVTAIPEATNVASTGVAVGTYPMAVAVDPLTNQLFVANNQGNTITQLNGVQYLTSAVAVGTAPVSLAENSGTIYVLNSSAGTVTPINESTNAAGSALTVGSNPSAAVAGPGSSVYVSNTGSSSVSAISGGTVTSITVGSNPGAIAFNPTASRIYVANVGTGTANGTVSVINPSTNTVVATVSSSIQVNPAAIGVNPVTNLVYVVNKGSNTVSIVNGATNIVSAVVGTGGAPNAIAIDTATDMEYVACTTSSSISVLSGTTHLGAITLPSYPSGIVIDKTRNLIYVLNTPTTGNGNVYVLAGLPAGATTTTGYGTLLATIMVGTNPSAIYLNAAANQIYVANKGGNTVTVIDGVSHATSSFATGSSPVALAMDAAGNLLYAVNNGGNSVTAASAFWRVPLNTTLAGLTDQYTISAQNGFQTSNQTQAFTAQVNSNYLSGANPPATAVYYQVDSTTGPWLQATLNTVISQIGTPLGVAELQNPAVFTIPSPSGGATYSLGSHTLYAIANYGNEGGYNSSGVYSGNSPEMGNIVSYPFSVVSAPTTLTASTVALSSSSNPATPGANVTYTATVTAGAAGTVEFFDGTTLLGSSSLSAGTATYTQTSITAGLHAITATYTGSGTYQPSSHNLFETTTGLSTPPTFTIPTVGAIQMVYAYNPTQCSYMWDIPDAGAKAWRDYDNTVHLLASGPLSRQMTGATLDTVVHQCPVLYQANGSNDPSHFDDQGWMETFYTNDGANLFGVVALDYHPYRHPGSTCDGSQTNYNCWYSTDTFVSSTDGGTTFTAPPPGQARFIAGAPVVFDPNQTANVVGTLVPSNIIPMNGAYFMFVSIGASAGAGGASSGDCLLRTTNLADPSSWRAWDGTGFNVQFLDPYSNSGFTVSQHQCKVINIAGGAYPARSLMMLPGSEGFIATVQMTNSFAASSSADLIHWSAPVTITSLPTAGNCTTNPSGPYYWYPSLIDSASPSRNFNTVSEGTSTVYLYLTQFNSCTGTADRSLVRIPITID